MILRLLLGALLLSSLASARLPGEGGIDVRQGATTICSTDILDLDATDFSCSCQSDGSVVCILGAGVTELGACIGETTDWCSTVDLTGKTVVLPEGTTLPAADGPARTHLRTDGSTALTWNVTTPFVFGGDGADGVFTYAGEGSGACSGNICNGGTCTGTTPTGTCTLAFNSSFGRVPSDGSNTDFAVVRNYSSFTMSAGTLTVGTPGVLGSPVILRVSGDVSITGGTVSLASKGAVGATSGSCASTTAGKSGGDSIYAGGAGGLSGNNAGAVGVAAALTTMRELPYDVPFLTAGTGGGACPVSGQTVAGGIAIGGAIAWSPWVGATGGGGGGCAASCGPGTCGAGGRGGGMLRIESAGTYTCTSATITVAGANGATGGGGGGGGGGVWVGTKILGTDSCTYTLTGGSAGGSPLTNCGAGAAGATGWTLRAVVPQ